jgi:hypothetical protein
MPIPHLKANSIDLLTEQFGEDRIGIPDDRHDPRRHLLNWPETHADMKPIENPLDCLFRRSIDEIARTVRSISKDPDPRSPRPTAVFKCGFHESYGIAHRVVCDLSKTAAQPAFTLDAACDNVVFAQAHHSVGSHIGSIDRNAKVWCRCNGFAPWLRQVVLVRLSDPLIESVTYCECMATQGSV